MLNAYKSCFERNSTFKRVEMKLFKLSSIIKINYIVDEYFFQDKNYKVHYLIVG